jgi:hypothetical protein
MNNIVYKYELHPGGMPTQMPKGATLLSVGFQETALQVWALVAPHGENVARRIAAVPTGRSCDLEGAVFVGTAHHPAGLVFHVFDFGEAP